MREPSRMGFTLVRLQHGTRKLDIYGRDTAMATREYGWYTQLLDHGAYFGDFADDFDHEAINSEYLAAINAALPDGFYLTGTELCGPADATEVPNVLAIAEGVDFDAIVQRHEIVNHERNTAMDTHDSDMSDLELLRAMNAEYVELVGEKAYIGADSPENYTSPTRWNFHFQGQQSTVRGVATACARMSVLLSDARNGYAWTGQTIAEFKAERSAMEAGRYPE